MKRVLRFTAVNILGLALLAAGTPLAAAPQDGNGRWQRNGDTRSQSAWTQPQRGDYNHGWDQADNRYRGQDRDYHYRGYRNDDRGGWGYRDDGRVYGGANGYRYSEGDNYYPDRDRHTGRTAAIIGGGAAAGAVIGAAAGHGQGAAIGAVVGGIAGVIASQAANHHDRQ